MLASPNQAASLFNPSGPHPVRQKHLFAVRFKRPSAPGTSLQGDLTFVVKQIDRPQVQPVVEEINQYNRKRLIHTGVKYSPVNCTLYDTADGAAMDMWLDYARYYFGDYNQPTATAGASSADAYSDDILNPSFNDPTADKMGFGYTIRRPGDNDFSIDGSGSQFYFSAVTVYQLWGNEYTSYDLINPRINTFAPDDLDYSNSEANTIQVNLTYEGIGHHNSGRPQDIFTEASLEEMFAFGPFNGQTLEVEGLPSTSFASPGDSGSLVRTPSSDVTLRDLLGGAVPTVGAELGLDREFTNSVGGVLNRFGVFDFGTVDPTQRTTLVNDTSNRISDSNRSQMGREALQLEGMANSINVAANRTGANPVEQTVANGGLALTEEAVNAFNETKDGTFFVGFRKDEN